MKQRLMAAVISVLLLALGIGAWHLATLPKGGAVTVDSEYAKLVGAQAAAGAKSAFPTPAELGSKLVEHVRDPFYDRGPNDKGIGVQLAYSIGRVLLGFFIAAAVAIPVGFVIGMSPLAYRAFDPFIQASGEIVIFVCSIWPMLINTAFGVASVRREWLNVARTLEVAPVRKAFTVILPAAAPTIMTGMRISVGIAWLVIVAAEMLVGGTGIGYFVWNEWNNLSIANILSGILAIGMVGMALDLLFSRLQKAVTYVD